ncbi:MAG TPA: hypothetical protein VFU21_26395 [Kofleriaceae bacterium]|nr:hypothetical protein [Kofleriaceae bacterium]
MSSLRCLAVLLVPALPSCSSSDDEGQPHRPPAPAAARADDRPGASAAAPVVVDVDQDDGGGEGGARGSRGNWRDAGVYLDGKPIGVLWFGELPEKLQPVWIDGERSLDFRPGDEGPRTAPVKLRRYRLRDYLAAAGVPIERVAMVHIYGPRQAVAAVSGRALRRAGDELYVGFGRETSGKPLIYFPADLETNTTFDHVSAVAVYVARKPPAVSPDGEVLLGGQPVSGIPYHGEPLRGGIRVYKDDQLAAWIKRRLLEGDERVTERVGDEVRFKLVPYLASLGVTTADVVRAHAVFDERRVLTLGQAELASQYFTASAQAQGHILLGAGKQPIQALELYTRPAPPAGK